MKNWSSKQNNFFKYQFRQIVVLKVEMPQGQEIGKDGTIYFRQVVVREVDGVELVQLREGSLRDVHDGVVAHVQDYDPCLVVHWNLENKF